MNKLKKNESGFGVVGGTLIALVFVLLSVVGYLVYKNQNKTTNSSMPKTDKSVTVTIPATPSNTTPKTDPNTGYLIIKEWGVKVKLEDSDKVTYVMNGTPNGSPNADSTTSIAALRLKDSVTASEACRALGMSIAQLTAATNATKIGKYYYGFEGGSDSCGDNSVDSLRAKITNSELVITAIVAE